MAKLYPPLIEGTIPAFEVKEGTVHITVPFSFNRAVGIEEVGDFNLKIKTISGSSTLASKESSIYNKLESKVTFIFDASLFTVGQYYKLQMAFIDKSGEIGYYSTVGVAKCTAAPDVKILELQEGIGIINNHNYKYTLTYSQENGDVTEKLYSVRFFVEDSDKNIVVDSGEILHNVTTDSNSYESCEVYQIPRDFEYGAHYKIYAKVTTTNGLVTETPIYKLTQTTSIDSSLDGILVAENFYDDGYIKLSLVGNKNENGAESSLCGDFSICRAASNEDYIWRELFTISVSDQKVSRDLWEDYTIEQGITYKYSIQEFNDKIYSNRILSEDVVADFEDAFLFDGERQLKIRFNPKVTSFKRDILEAKIDTIGSQFPFIFRNGNVNYHEFPISGLVSYKMDENRKFLTEDELEIEDNSFNLTSENMYAERFFKLKVLDWLTNGKPKLFKSPGEGNYIVRLLNVSMSPQDPLGRMLHTFNSTAYEVAEFSYDNLLDLDIVEVEKQASIKTVYKTVNIAGVSDDFNIFLNNLQSYVDANVSIIISSEIYSRLKNSGELSYLDDNFATKLSAGNYSLDISALKDKNIMERFLELKNIPTYATTGLISSPIYSINISDMKPGTIIEFTTENGDKEQIIIGSTGAYYADFDSPIYNVEIIATGFTVSEDGTFLQKELILEQLSGTMTYSYKEAGVSSLGTVESYTPIDVPCQQWIGTPHGTTFKYSPDLQWYDEINTTDLITILTTEKTTIQQIYSLKFYAKEIKNIFAFEDNYYWDMDCQNKVTEDQWNPTYLYAVCNPREDYTYHGLKNEQYYIDAIFREGYYIKASGEKISIFTGKYLTLSKLKTLLMDNGAYTYEKTLIDAAFNVFDVKINNQLINLKESKEYKVLDFSKVFNTITFGDGIICEIGYQYTLVNYSFEDRENSAVNIAKKNYEQNQQIWSNIRNDIFNETYNTIAKKGAYEELMEVTIPESYTAYIRQSGLEKYSKDGGE